jgi:alpha-amylase
MLVCNNASGYNYGGYLEQALLTAGWAPEDVAKTKIWASYYPKEPGIDCGNIAMNRKAVQNDDADQQMPGSTSRDMGNAGCVLVSDCSSIEEHRQFEVTLFSNPPGSSDNDNDYPIRLVLSQFYFNIAQQPYGFPDGQSDCAKCQGPWCATCTGSMPFWPAYNASAVGYDGPVYTHVHRDAAIVAAMRAWMQLPALEAESSAPLIAGPVPQGIFA